MKIPSSNVVIAYPLNASISSDMTKILGTSSMNYSLIVIDVCIYCLSLEI